VPSGRFPVVLSVGLGPWPFAAPDPDAFWRFIDRAEALAIDSLWLSDRLLSPPGGRAFVLDPLIALAGAAARTRRLKLGTSVYVLPLRHPVLAAKELATLDFLAGGRLLLAVGVGVESEPEYEACGVPKAERGARLDEAIPLLRRLWREPMVTHQGRFFSLHAVSLDPKPLGPMPIWLGGRSDAAYRRLGRLGDGWLPSSITPAEIAAGIRQIQRYAAEAGREIEADHFGVLLAYCVADSREQAQRLAEPYLLRSRSDQPPVALAALGTLADCIEAIERRVQAGASKFVLRPACPPELLEEQLEALAALQRAVD